MATKTKQLGPFLGENNRLPDFRLSGESGAFVRSAINVDLTDASTFKRRQGVERKVSGTDCHSFWSNGSVAYFIDYDTLYSLSSLLSKTAVLPGIAPGQQMSYCEQDGVIRCSNGSNLWTLSGSTAAIAGINAPTLQPVLSVATGGSLPAGIYQATISFISPVGEESGALRPVTIAVPEGSALTISGIQQSAGYQTCVYLTPPNGDALFRLTKTSAASVSVSVAPRTDGVRCRTLLLARIPPGQIVRYSDARLLVANGSTLFYSELYAPHLYNPAKNYIPFAADITMVEPVEGGVYVSADKTYWLAGDISQAPLAVATPNRAVIGTSGLVESTNSVFWMSERGMTVGAPGGQVENLQEKNVAVNPALAGASLYREQDGMRQMISSVFGAQNTVMAARDFMDFEVIRKETEL